MFQSRAPRFGGKLNGSCVLGGRIPRSFGKEVQLIGTKTVNVGTTSWIRVQDLP